MRILGAGYIGYGETGTFTLPKAGKTVYTEVVYQVIGNSAVYTYFGFHKGYGEIYSQYVSTSSKVLRGGFCINSNGSITCSANAYDYFSVNYVIFEVDE